MSATPRATGAYRRLLADPAARSLTLADVCARLPQGMTSITLLLVVATHASMATAGLAVAGYTIGQAVTGPLRGRLADRHGLARVCAILGGAYAIAFALLTTGAMARSQAGVLIAAATATGIVVPPLSPGMRSLWSAHATGAKAAAGVRQAAFALDAAVFDLTALTGPVVASALATGADPAAGTGVLLALTGVAIVIIGRRVRSAGNQHAAQGARRGAGRARGLVPGPLRSAAVRRLLVTGFLVNAALSVTEVALTAYARQHHAVWASGPLLAEVSAGSIIGSLLLGARAPARDAAGAASLGTGAGRLRRLLAGYAAGLAVLTVAAALSGAPFWGAAHSGILTSAGSYPLLIAIAAPVAGVWLGPSLATLFGLASRSAPGGGTEAQGWLNSMMNGGASAGAALAGLAAGRPALSLGLAAVAAALAAVVAVAGAFSGDGTGAGSRGSREGLEMFSSGNPDSVAGL